jgi:hypothetical protein
MSNVEDYAIVVGINRYPGIRNLAGAEKDASQFAKWLGDPQGGDLLPQNIRLILSSNFEQPAKTFAAQPVQRDIDAILDEFGINEKDRVGRRLYFFFAGHGLAPSFDDVVLLMANASRRALNSNVGVRNYRKFLRDAASFDEVILILDCCREFEDRAEPTIPPFTARLAQDRAAKVKDVCVMAAGYGKKAFEPKLVENEDRRGLLSQALMEALQEHKASVTAQNEITAVTLVNYLVDRVPELAKAATLEQKPEISPNPVPDIVLVKLSAAPAVHQVKTCFTVDPASGGELVLKTNELVEIGRRPVDQTPWEVLLDPGIYVITHSLQTDKLMVIDARKPQEVANEYRLE